MRLGIDVNAVEARRRILPAEFDDVLNELPCAVVMLPESERRVLQSHRVDLNAALLGRSNELRKLRRKLRKPCISDTEEDNGDMALMQVLEKLVVLKLIKCIEPYRERSQDARRRAGAAEVWSWVGSLQFASQPLPAVVWLLDGTSLWRMTAAQ